MTEHLQVDYIDRVLKPYALKINKPLLLIWDSHSSHMTPMIKNYITITSTCKLSQPENIKWAINNNQIASVISSKKKLAKQNSSIVLPKSELIR